LALHIDIASDLHKRFLEISKELKMNIAVSTNVSQPLSHARISKIIFKSLGTPTYKNVQSQERNGQFVACENYSILQYC
jgi:hypothetical protein